MIIILQSARYALPILFFGYAILANLSVLARSPPAIELTEGDLLSGGLTRGFDDSYKSALPHIAPSFGLVGAARYALLDEARHGALVGTDGWLFTSEEMRTIPSSADLATIVDSVRGVRERLLQSGTDLVMLPLPAKIDIARAFSPEHAYGEAMEGLYAEFSAQMAGSGLTVVNSRSGIASGDDLGFFATDTHWTPDGALRVAHVVAQSGALQHGNLGYRRIAAAQKSLTGDLVGFVTTPGLASYINLAPERIVPVVQSPLASGSDIFGDAAPDIVLVGTSYSANSDWGFVDALMHALGRDVISLAEEGRGPMAPMQKYLASDDFATAPPAVVIWEIPVRYLTDPALWDEVDQPAPALASSLSGQNSDG